MTSHLKPDAFEPGQIVRKSFGLRKEIQDDLVRDYYSDIIQRIIAAGNTYTEKDVTFHLASSFGFCYGVDRAVEMAYETKERFPDRRIFLTAQIIHNPRVNQNLQEMGVSFLKEEDYHTVRKDDVVILPAFGATSSQILTLKGRGCVLVDTICGSVLNVWKRVENYAQEGFTAVIHGKYYHEETQATSSRLLGYEGGKYLVVLNMAETKTVCDYIRNGGNPKEFLEKFSKQVAPGFDPDKDLQRIGLANQTTMLMSESLAIAEKLKQAMLDRHGADYVARHFKNFDTICSATEDRQNAIVEFKDKALDLIMVVGGYNSSNTNHLAKMAASFTRAYHIEDADGIVSESEIRHKPFGQFDTVVTKDWLPAGPLRVGLTSGASTPNQVLGEVVEKILSFR
ncbi:MAG TPA: 4-hydroxy-3-methylbut-2-enyl diphosphate reductase [bacterium]|nr:4-hydroxy-3-methylbut-2-enyl diphosphate reductase [bacterium]